MEDVTKFLVVHVQMMPRLAALLLTQKLVQTVCVSVQYICMEDVTKRISHPCIADAKIGPITYDPDASPEKKQYELLKFKDLVKVRFRLSGMRVWQ